MADGRIEIDTRINEKGAQKGLNSLQRKVSGSAKKMQQVGGQMTKYITAPLAAVGAAGFAAADQLDKAYRDIQVGTGATGDALEDLKDSFKTVFEDVPDSADQVSGALATLNTLTGETGKVLEDLTKGVLDASRTLGEDGVANSEAFGRALKQWEIPAEDGTKALDGLYKLTQDYGVGLGELSGQLTTYGSVLGNAGFEMEEAAEFMASLESNGISVSRVMPGLNKSFRNWADEGKNSREELEKVIDQMKEAETSTEALSIASEVFGAEGAQRITTAVRNGAIPALDELGDTMEGTEGLVQDTTESTRTIGEEFQILKNNTMTALEPVGRIMIDLGQQYIPLLVDAVQSVAEWFQNLSPAGQKVVIAIGAIIAILPPLIMLAGSLAIAVMGITWPVALVVAGIAALIAIGVALVANWDWIKEKTIAVWTFIGVLFETVWNTITTAFKAAVSLISTLISATWNTIKAVTSTVWNGIKAFFVTIWNSIKALFVNRLNFVKNLLSTIWNTIKNVTSSVWNGIKSTLSGIWNGLKSSVSSVFNGIKNTITSAWNAVSSTTSDIWNGIVGTIKGAINGVISAINGMLNAIGNISISLPSVPDWVPGIGGRGGGTISFPNIPNIPSLDVGTNLVTRDGLAMIHAGEKIVPAEHTGPYTGKDGNTPEYIVVQMDIDGRATARALAKPIEDIQERRTIEKLRAEGRY